jgi:hypothetical protein
MHTKLAFALIVAFVLLSVFGSAAYAECAPNHPGRGTLDCPAYTAPATTALPQTHVDGSIVVSANVLTTLFNGAVPPNGFMVQSLGVNCYVNDNGPAKLALTGQYPAGFFVPGQVLPAFVTPPGYKPMGVVSIICTASNLCCR